MSIAWVAAALAGWFASYHFVFRFERRRAEADQSVLVNWYGVRGVSSGDGWVGVGSYRFADSKGLELLLLDTGPVVGMNLQDDGGWRWAIIVLRPNSSSVWNDAYHVVEGIRRFAHKPYGTTVVGLSLAFETNSIAAGPVERRFDPTRGIAIHWLWFVGASTLLAVGRWRRYAILRRRRSHGCCIACGYDLRATTGNACSECGVARA